MSLKTLIESGLRCWLKFIRSSHNQGSIECNNCNSTTDAFSTNDLNGDDGFLSVLLICKFLNKIKLPDLQDVRFWYKIVDSVHSTQQGKKTFKTKLQHKNNWEVSFVTGPWFLFCKFQECEVNSRVPTSHRKTICTTFLSKFKLLLTCTTMLLGKVNQTTNCR